MDKISKIINLELKSLADHEKLKALNLTINVGIAISLVTGNFIYYLGKTIVPNIDKNAEGNDKDNN